MKVTRNDFPDVIQGPCVKIQFEFWNWTWSGDNLIYFTVRWSNKSGTPGCNAVSEQEHQEKKAYATGAVVKIEENVVDKNNCEPYLE